MVKLQKMNLYYSNWYFVDPGGFVCRHSVNNSFDLFPFHGRVKENSSEGGYSRGTKAGSCIWFITTFRAKG